MRTIFRARLVVAILMTLGLMAGGVSVAAAQTSATPVVTPDPNTSGTVNVSKFYCTNVTETTFQTGEVGVAAAIPSTEGDCAPGAATFTFYFVGDQTADYAQLDVDGAGSIGLPAGDYEVVEENTQASTFITVTDGGVLTLVVTNPVVEPGATPVVPTEVAPGGNGHHGHNHGKTTTSSTVSSLPNTGQGSSSSNSSTIVLLFGAMSLVALAAGFAWRQRRSA